MLDDSALSFALFGLMAEDQMIATREDGTRDLTHEVS